MTHVVLDVSPPALHGMNLNGKLSFADNNDLELTTEWILLRGELQAGSENNPHTRNATITLTDNVPGENINGMGDRGILIVGGTLSLHGDRENAWTKQFFSRTNSACTIAGHGGSRAHSDRAGRVFRPGPSSRTRGRPDLATEAWPTGTTWQRAPARDIWVHGQIPTRISYLSCRGAEAWVDSDPNRNRAPASGFSSGSRPEAPHA